MQNKILIQKKYLIFRDSAQKIGQQIKKIKTKKVFLDFSKVSFMSRSFIDELLNQIEKSKKEIKFLGLDPSLSKFISKVKQTKLKIRKNFS